MQVPEKNIKGFNLLELIVVIVIVGILSASAYPKFQSWSKEREVRLAVTKIQSIIKNIHVQTERGTFGYVQVRFTNSGDNLTVTTKGMTMDTLASKINDGDDPWNQDFPANVTDRCSLDAGYWDTDTADADASIRNFVTSVSFEDVTTTFIEGGGTGGTGTDDGDTAMDMVGSSESSGAGTGAVCFSRGGKYYEANGPLLSDASLPRGFIYICRRESSGYTCPVTFGSDENEKEEPSPKSIKYLNTVEWSRFGNFSKSQWGGTNWFSR